MTKRRILVVGASSVLGGAIARQAMAEGEQVWGTYRTQARGEILQQTLSEARFSKVDVLLPADVQRLQEEVSASWPGLDGLVCAFGAGLLLPVQILKDADASACVEVNLMAVIRLLRVFHPLLAKGKGSSVVLLSSIMGLSGAGGMAAYAASKGGLSALARSLAIEWAPRGIRVNALAPGIVPSPLVDGMFARLGANQVEAIRQKHPLGFGTSADVAHAACFLLSEKARWITGVVLPVDGGYTAQ